MSCSLQWSSYTTQLTLVSSQPLTKIDQQNIERQVTKYLDGQLIPSVLLIEESRRKTNQSYEEIKAQEEREIAQRETSG